MLFYEKFLECVCHCVSARERVLNLAATTLRSESGSRQCRCHARRAPARVAARLASNFASSVTAVAQLKLRCIFRVEKLAGELSAVGEDRSRYR